MWSYLRLRFWLWFVLLMSSFWLNASSLNQWASGRPNPKGTALSNFTAPSILFQATLGGSGNDFAEGVALDPSGNMYVTGYVDRLCCDSLDSFLLKFNSNGSLLWQRKWLVNTSYFAYFSTNRVVADASGNVYVSGYTHGNAAGDPLFGDLDAALMKFDTNGNLLWQRRWGGNSTDYAAGIALAPSGEVYVVGSTRSFDSYQGGFILKLSSNGSLLWQSLWGQGLNVFLTGVSVIPSGEFFVSGFSGSNQNAVLLKFDSDGNLEWEKMWGAYGMYSVDLTAVSADSSGNVYETGLLQDYTKYFVNTEVPIVKFDSSGNMIWQRLWPGSGNFCCSTSGKGMVIDGTGNVFLIGQAAHQLYGILLLEVSSSGDLEWVGGLGRGTGDVGRSLIMDSSGNLIGVGSVAEGPPYSISGLDYKLLSSNFTLQTIPAQLTTTNVPATPSNVDVFDSNFSTVYAGQGDAYIGRLKPPQLSQTSTTTLPTNPANLLVATVVAVAGVVILRRRRTTLSSPREKE